jgi:hypothetical protein
MKFKVLVFVLLLAIPMQTFAATFSDIENSEFKTFIEFLANKGIINGYSDGTFKPDNNITYGEALKIIYESAEAAHIVDVSVDYKPDLSTYMAQAATDFPELSLVKDDLALRGNLMYLAMMTGMQVYKDSNIYMTYENPFDDIDSTDLSYDAIMAGYYMGFIKGYSDGTFKPDRPVTRGEFSKMIYNIYFEEKSPIGACYRDGGTYGHGGKSSWAVCFEEFDDGGDACSDNRDCEGACLVEDTTQDEGICQEMEPTFGCYGMLVYDEISGRTDVEGICID